MAHLPNIRMVPQARWHRLDSTRPPTSSCTRAALPVLSQLLRSGTAGGVCQCGGYLEGNSGLASSAGGLSVGGRRQRQQRRTPGAARTHRRARKGRVGLGAPRKGARVARGGAGAQHLTVVSLITAQCRKIEQGIRFRKCRPMWLPVKIVTMPPRASGAAQA